MNKHVFSVFSRTYFERLWALFTKVSSCDNGIPRAHLPRRKSITCCTSSIVILLVNHTSLTCAWSAKHKGSSTIEEISLLLFNPESKCNTKGNRRRVSQTLDGSCLRMVSHTKDNFRHNGKLLWFFHWKHSQDGFLLFGAKIVRSKYCVQVDDYYERRNFCGLN